ncbi:uncharacterized protein LOC128223165 isoform X2 [Mya arenaria]|uniref:uncharacterized protein LOC128223165 isoform X2 n=1 Tax=Mya arenaria TaxID=6604 RepID=UPI0022E75BCD|nr:uncharacterized protein LOC128223165 isoform X2 [Mya arenaria]
MSTYENYESVSKTYDDQRKAMGSDVIAGMIQLYCKKPLSELHVLDAGCGTGNYARDLLDHGCGHVTLLDASPGMLEKARAKVADYIESGRVKDIVEAKLPKIPFPDGTFDAVMFNLVLHHIDSKDDETYSEAVQALAESRRVIGPNGIIIITTVLKDNITNIWYCNLNEKLNKRFCKRMPSLEQFNSMFRACALKCVQRMNFLGSSLVSNYGNYEGPLDKEWRSFISYWAYATDEELDEIKQKVTDLKEKGQLVSWCKARDHVDTSGFITLFLCQPKSS